MMLKRLAAALLCLLLIFAVGCGKNPADSSEPETSSEAAPVVKPVEKPVLNPLTGEKLDNKEAINNRPVAVMVNNISIAQPVQCGLVDADIVYETEVEGGITRLMAVYQDVASVDRIGPVRSARYPYIDLAMGHNAIYIHAGQDPNYAAPHLKDLDDADLLQKNWGKRISNGLASEHTLYTFGKTLWDGLNNAGWKTESTSNEAWQNFADEETDVQLSGSCLSVKVPFSNSYSTVMQYDATTGRYNRFFGNTQRKDYQTKKNVSVKNVFVLLTTISDYPDGYHRRVALQDGTGYYCVNGTYTPILWSKGNAKNGFTFTNADGSPLQVATGNSWVCIADKNMSQPIFTGEEPTE